MINLSDNMPHCMGYDALVSLAAQQLAEHDPRDCALVSVDFDNFNYINDLFGYMIGDEVLRRFAEHLRDKLETGEYFCHLHADQFILWLHEKESTPIVERVEDIMNVSGIMDAVLPVHYNLVCSGGIAHANSPDESFPILLDKANFARKRAKGSYKSVFLCYDQGMAEDLKWRKAVSLLMDSALENHEFEMYLQPKVHIKTGQIAGAEALVRWNSGKYGMIYPDRFIPIMEQNGFVRQLDFFILNQACRYLQTAGERRVPVLPISVNFSKAHVRDAQFAERVFQTVNRYGIPTGLIEIEFTENVFTNDFQRLINVATDLKFLGFRVALDDFGSAYSSLNCLKDIPLDIIKIDKSFLDFTADTERGRIIVAKVVELIKSLRMISVMEGIENEEQAEFLKKLSCDMGQGYHYAKPMPQEEYTRFLRRGEPYAAIQTLIEKPADKSHLYAIPQEFQLDNWELYTLGKNIDIGLMKGYLDGGGTVQYINDRALEYLGYTRQEFREVFNNSIIAFTHPDDAAIVQKNAERLIRTGRPLKFQIRAIRKDGKVIVLQGRSSCVADSQGRMVGLYAFHDVTDELERAAAFQRTMKDKITELKKTVEALRLSEERYRLIVERSDDIMYEWDYATDTISFSSKFQKLFGHEPICHRVSENPDVIDRVHPQDREKFKRWIGETFRKPNSLQNEFRFQAVDGAYIWMRVCSTAICDEAGTPIRGIGVFSNIDVAKRKIEALTRKSQIDSLTKLFHKEETRLRVENWLGKHPRASAAFFIVDIDNFKAISDNLGHQVGDDVLRQMAVEVRKLFRKSDIIGRVGWDEMVVFAAGFNREADLAQRAAALVETMHDTRLEPNCRHAFTVSVGAARYPEHGRDFEALYHAADVALYAAKQGGKNRSAVYRSGMRGKSPGECAAAAKLAACPASYR